MDTLDFILGVYLLQKYANKIQYLITYYTKKLTPLELNYNIYNKELLGIIQHLKNKKYFCKA